MPILDLELTAAWSRSYFLRELGNYLTMPLYD